MAAAQRPARRSRLTPGQWAVWAVLVLGGLVMVFPIYWMLVTALTPGGQAQSPHYYLWPSTADWSNFKQVWEQHPIGQWLVNSLVIAVLSVVLAVFMSLLGGYAFAKFRFFGRDLLFAAVLVTIMVPIQVVMVPEFVIVSKLGLVDSPWGVILPRAAEAVALFLARQFMLGIPDDLINAARIDGASEFRIFLRIILPLSGPLVGVLVILTFVWRWNDFVWPLVALQGQQHFTLPLGLNSMHNLYSSPWQSIMAVSLISIIPTVVIFMIFQRKFVQGIVSSGLK